MTQGWSRRAFLAAGGGAAGSMMLPAATASAAAPASAAADQAAAIASEPSVEVAKNWWPNPRNIWTPIGWKDHLFRFNVVYNGSVIAAPCPLGRTTPGVREYEGQGIQLDMTPWGGWFQKEGTGPHRPLGGHFYVYRDDYGHYGHGSQSWADHPAPVLQTDWPQSTGVVLRQSVFAHTYHGADTVTGKEMLFGWIRLSVESVNPLGTSGPIGFAVRVARPYYTQEYPYTFQDGVTLTGYPELAPFPDSRWLETKTVGGKTVKEFWQPQGPRMGIVAGPGVSLPPALVQPEAGKFIYHLEANLPPVVGAHLDLMLTQVPTHLDEFEEELALGYDAALADANRFWSRRSATAATVKTPEPYVNEAIERNIQFSQVIAERTPGTLQPTFLTGSYGYDVLWSTPTSMISHMFLSLLGHHDVVAAHLELYRSTQGSVKPPGAAYAMHPGFYSTPSNLIAIDWITDHGAIMTAVATHALMSGDQAFVDRWLVSLVKACDFVKDACANTNHSGVKGIPPAAVATDEGIEVQSVWNMAWLYKGLSTTIRLLRRLNHPRTAEFETVAANFKSRVSEVFDSYGATQPKWKHPDGNLYPVYSQNLTDSAGGSFGEIVRLDAGPMVMVWAGLMSGSDQRMVKFADYFRYGPNVALWGDGNRKNALDRPVLIHEMSSCEPVYSWNVFHSWQNGDRARFLEGMYSLLVGGMSPQTYIPFEHRHGMASLLGPIATATWLVRHAVLDDSLVDNELQLLRLCPQAWLTEDADTEFAAMATIYGPVSLKFRRAGTELRLTWSGAWRERPGKVYVHVPPGISTLTINGTSYSAPPGGKLEVPS